MDIWIISQKAPLVNYFVNYLSMITLYYINFYALSEAFGRCFFDRTMEITFYPAKNSMAYLLRYCLKTV